MKKSIILFTVFFIFSAIQMDSYAQRSPKKVDLHKVPKISAYKAYLKYRTGKVILIHAGGENFRKRHILNAIPISQEAVRRGEIKLPKLPKRGKEIITYCY